MGLPLIPPYNKPDTVGSKILQRVNYASTASGIRNETGTLFVKLLGQTFYYPLTTGSGQQTLGEEYCDISQVLPFARDIMQLALRANLMFFYFEVYTSKFYSTSNKLSDSGKTTLLTALGGPPTKNKLSGKITYNGLPFSSMIKCRTGFVAQDDVLYAHLTVSETLIFTALLRLPRTLSTTERVCCCWMNPSLLLLDEPTLGLDSTNAQRIVTTLKRLIVSLVNIHRL